MELTLRSRNPECRSCQLLEKPAVAEHAKDGIGDETTVRRPKIPARTVEIADDTITRVLAPAAQTVRFYDMADEGGSLHNRERRRPER
jgi:hypothetical protein